MAIDDASNRRPVRIPELWFAGAVDQQGHGHLDARARAILGTRQIARRTELTECTYAPSEEYCHDFSHVLADQPV
jgi:hypothetical protein